MMMTVWIVGPFMQNTKINITDQGNNIYFYYINNKYKGNLTGYYRQSN